MFNGKHSIHRDQLFLHKSQCTELSILKPLLLHWYLKKTVASSLRAPVEKWSAQDISPVSHILSVILYSLSQVQGSSPKQWIYSGKSSLQEWRVTSLSVDIGVCHNFITNNAVYSIYWCVHTCRKQCVLNLKTWHFVFIQCATLYTLLC